MNEASRSRVVVWLDPAAPQENLREVLAGLGSVREILGLFIEDMSLMELSQLPVAREFSFDASTTRTLNQDDIERQFRAHAMRMQKLFEAAAGTIGGSHSFQVTRGQPGAELVKVSTNCDMLVIAHSRHYLAPRLTLRARLDELLTSGPPTLLFVQEQWRTGQCIAVFFDGSDASPAALRTAASLALADDLQLSIWLPSKTPDARDKLVARCDEILGEAPRRSFLSLNDHNTDEMVRVAAAVNARALVLPASEPADTRRIVTELLERINCSLIVAR